MDYFVPNFGVDPEITNAQASLSETEKLMEQKFNLPDPDTQKPGYPVNYSVPNFGPDHDIRTSKKPLLLLKRSLATIGTLLPTKTASIPCHNQSTTEPIPTKAEPP